MDDVSLYLPDPVEFVSALQDEGKRSGKKQELKYAKLEKFCRKHAKHLIDTGYPHIGSNQTRVAKHLLNVSIRHAR